jgi:hypothetical protein
MLHRRRFLLTSLAICTAALASGCVVRPARPVRARPHALRRRVVRRRVRRRFRRRAAWRVVAGRRRLVVPVAMVVGWELMVDSRVVVVREVRPTVIVVAAPSGPPEELEYDREDTSENREEHPGSVVGSGDDHAPYREEDEDVEEDE